MAADQNDELVKTPMSFRQTIAMVVKNITIEPAMFLISFSAMLDSVANSQMVVLKSCKTDFGYNDTVCNNLSSDEFEQENINVSNEVNNNLKTG